MKRKADMVADALLGRIVRGDVAPGDVLAKEQSLADEFGVNRGVVREAIKLLEVHRLVQPVRRRGTVVLDPMASMSPEVVEALLRPAAGMIDRRVLAEFLELRADLDAQVTAYAAERRSEEDLEALELLVESLSESIDDPERYLQVFERFSHRIVASTHNRLFMMLYHWHHRIQAVLGEVLISVRRPSDAHLSGVRFLVQMIRAQDVDGVRNLVQVFHRWATPRIMATAALQEGVPLSEVVETLQ